MAKPAKPKWRRLKRLAGILLVVLILCCPWPSDNSSYVGSKYQKTTLSRLRATKPAPAKPTNILAGIAEIDISPPMGHPLAGYSSRRPQNFTDVHSPCFARALTLVQNSQKVTILAADILAIVPSVARLVLDKAGLTAEEVYFTSSHTHSGPGGYVDNFVMEWGLGKYDARYFEDLTTKLAEVIRQSRLHLTKVEMGILKIDVLGQLKNRIDNNLPNYDKLSALIFREATDNSKLAKTPLAVLVSFGAHATILGHHQHYLSSDYPGALVEELKQRTGAKMVCFAAGALGSSRPKIHQPGDRIERVAAYGKTLADSMINQWSTVQYNRQLKMSNVRLDVDLPPLAVAISSNWRLSPLFTFWLPSNQTQIHMLRLGPVVLVGFPADYSGDLALELDNWFSSRGLELVPTSFNGDWRGYFVSSEVFFKYRKPETRVLSWFGPWIGEYFNDLAKQIFTHVESLENN